MDSVGSGDFDMEAQSLLETGSVEFQARTPPNVKVRRAFFKIILLVRSTNLFKSAAAANAGSSSSSDYGVSGSPDQELGLIQGFEDVAVAEIQMEIFNDSSITDKSEKQNSGLQLKKINEIVREKNVDELNMYGGVGGMAEALNTDLKNGISIVPEENSTVQGSWISRVLTTFLHSLLVACNNYTIFLLVIAAVLSLAFGINEEGLDNGWYDGAIILLIVFALVIFPTMRNFWREMMPGKKSWMKGRMKVRVVRQGCDDFIPKAALHVGDIVVLKKGDQVPADGIFVGGQALELDGGFMKSISVDETNPFILYPSRVINGDARMIVTATGMGTSFGEMLSDTRSPGNKCKFETYLHKVSTFTHVAGLIISIFVIILLFLRYKAGKLDDENGTYGPDPKGEPTRPKTFLEAINKIITESKGTTRCLTAQLGVSLLGIMEGMPFVISIAILILNRRALACKASVRNRLACVRMAPTTILCSDKFGGLSKDEFVIDKFFVGGKLVGETSVVASNVLEQLCDGICALFLICPDGGCRPKLDQLISWAEAKLGMKKGSLRQQISKVSSERHNPFQECCQVFMDKGENEGQSKYCFYTGPPEHVLCLCSHYYDIEGEEQELDGNKRKMFDWDIQRMVTEGSEMIAYARERLNGCDELPIETNGVVFIGMIGLEETKSGDTRSTLSTLKNGGIKTVIASGDDVELLKTIGQIGGILDPAEPHSLVVTGQQFRDWTDEERKECIERIRIIGNCLTSDKILLIKCLQEKGHVVALMAQKTIDAPALVQADIALTFGTWSSEIAREFCDMCIWDHCCFNVVATAIETGRCFQHNVRKFIQLLVIFTLSSSSINFMATVVLGDAPITTVQLSYLNVVVAFVGGAALLMGPPTEQLMMESAPNPSQKLITKSMWRNIAIQATYQTTVLVALQHKGQAILGITQDRVKSMIYNGFFLCQAFNKFIAREPEGKNIFNGLCKKKQWFWVALFVMILCQVGFGVVEKLIGWSPELNWELGGLCLFIGLVSWVLDWVGKICGQIWGKVKSMD